MHASLRIEALKLLGHFIRLHEDARQQVQAAVQGIVDSVLPSRFSEERKGAAQCDSCFAAHMCLTSRHHALSASL